MKEPLENSVLSEKSPETTLGRRELFKVLIAASGGIAAASLVPGEWVKPVVEAGLLPAHAQGSPVALTPADSSSNVTTT